MSENKSLYLDPSPENLVGYQETHWDFTLQSSQGWSQLMLDFTWDHTPDEQVSFP